MGQIIRLDTKFQGERLKKLIEYDVSGVLADLLNVSTLRAFYDCTDVSTMTLGAGGKVTQLNDISGNNKHFLQSNTALAPTFTELAIGRTNGISFNGAQYMRATDLFSASEERTVVILFYVGQEVAGNNMMMSAAGDLNENFYKKNTGTSALSGSVNLSIANINNKIINGIYAYNKTTKVSNIYADGTNISGTVLTTKAGDVNLGRWADSNSTAMFTGNIGHIMVFDEDLSKNKIIRDLVNEYALRKY